MIATTRTGRTPVPPIVAAPLLLLFFLASIAAAFPRASFRASAPGGARAPLPLPSGAAPLALAFDGRPPRPVPRLPSLFASEREDEGRDEPRDGRRRRRGSKREPERNSGSKLLRPVPERNRSERASDAAVGAASGYSRVAGTAIDPSVCPLSESDVDAAISERARFRRAKEYDRADAIWRALRRNGVSLDDRSATWRADGRDVRFEARGRDLTGCETVGEAAAAAREALGDSTARDRAAFWTIAARLLPREGRGRGGGRGTERPPGRRRRRGASGKLPNVGGGGRDDARRRREREAAPRAEDALAERLDAIFAKTLEGIGDCEARDLTQTALAFAKITRHFFDGGMRRRRYAAGSPRAILHGILFERRSFLFRSVADAARDRLERRPEEFDARCLPNLAYAYALAGSAPEVDDDGATLFDRLGDRSVPLLRDFAPQGLSNMVWAYARSGATHPRFFEGVADRIVEMESLDGFELQGLSNIVWSFARTGASHPRLFEKIADHIVSLDNLGTFEPQFAANTLWAYERAGARHPRLFEKFAASVQASPDGFGRFKPPELATVLRAFARSGTSDPRLLRLASDRATVLIDEGSLRPRELSTLVRSLAAAGVTRPRLFRGISDVVVASDCVDAFRPRDLADVMWSFRRADVDDPFLFLRLADRASDLLDGAGPGSFGPRELTEFARAYAAAGMAHPDLFPKLAEAMREDERGGSDAFGPRELADALWALAAAGGAEGSGAFARAGDRIDELVRSGSMEGEALEDVLWAYETAGMSLPRSLRDVTDRCRGSLV